MKFSFTLDTDNPPEPHEERHANRLYLDKIGMEAYYAACVGLLTWLAVYMPHEEFKLLVKYSREAFQAGAHNALKQKMD